VTNLATHIPAENVRSLAFDYLAVLTLFPERFKAGRGNRVFPCGNLGLVCVFVEKWACLGVLFETPPTVYGKGQVKGGYDLRIMITEKQGYTHGLPLNVLFNARFLIVKFPRWKAPRGVLEIRGNN
jgi:hypothetical protein